MFFYLFVLIFIVFFVINCLTINIVVWWRVFVLITLTFIFLQKKQGDFQNSLNYFLLQEFLGFLFLIFIAFNLQLLVLFIKVGVSPLHFWIFNVFSGSDNFLLMWFLTFQKLPFLPVLLTLYKFYQSIFLFFGVFFCYYQLFVVKQYKLIFALSSTESFNWLLIGIYSGFFGFIIFSVYYFISIVVILSYQTFGSFINYYLELMVIFLNIPLSFRFFVKIFILRVAISLNVVLVLLLLITIVLSSLSFIHWLVYYSVRSNKLLRDQLRYYFILVYVFSLIVYFFRFSKINYVILIG